VSQWRKQEKKALSKILKNDAPLTVATIEEYELRPNLFGK